ncbi:hypothetical protein [Candidatus Methanocrinis natronophilus]|uniref:Cell wall-binding repeat-containing protein n=1 Tax=Candidatus Methanocrinis natronophilus TaxID=3033396 RepID=A0ABT5X9X5_9EURY|nr:hypothetical protein [Candidatus Methanocrinis natronophilus]MDF0591511.1 hypothetical protein [Candidatus Methanocrinis natronophilus]
MKLFRLLAILSLLVAVSAAELAADRDRFEVELHPGEMTKRTLIIENLGDKPVFSITSTPVAGTAKEMVKVTIPKFEKLGPESEDVFDKEELKVEITFSSDPQTDPGSYTGHVYFFDDTPSLPLKVEFAVELTEQESYGVSLTIDDARSASATVDPDEAAVFGLLVRNAGLFRDVISVDLPHLPPRWTAVLFDGGMPASLPYNLTLSSGVSRVLRLEIVGGRAGEVREIEVMATSLGDPSKNASVKAEVELNHEVRAYEAILKLPEAMVVNRTHTGSITINLNVDERITVEVEAPPELMVMPRSLVIPVGKTRSGEGEFTLMATSPGRYEIRILLHDSFDVPLPTERAELLAIETDSFAIVTGDGLLYRALALSYAEGRKDVAVTVVTLTGGEMEAEEMEELQAQPLARVLILGNESIVPSEVERALSDMMPTERIAGVDICETSWIFVSTLWPDGGEMVVLVGTDEVEAFEAYEEAKKTGSPLIICSGPLSEASLSALEDIKALGLKRALVWGTGVDGAVIEALEDAGISIEEEL